MVTSIQNNYTTAKAHNHLCSHQSSVGVHKQHGQGTIQGLHECRRVQVSV